MKPRKKVKTVDEYIRSFPKSTQTKLRAVRAAVKKATPKAQEGISYGMPAFKLKGVVVYFAGYQHHIGFYPFPSAIRAFKKEASRYKTAKGSIQFPLNKPLPISLIQKIVKFRMKENLAKKKHGFAAMP